MQTAMYARYHVTDVNAFYTGNLAWSVAKEPGRTQQDVQAVTQTSTGIGGVTTVTSRTPRIAPYYTLLQLPGDSKPEFVQLRPFAPVEQKGEATQLLEGFMTVSSEPGSLGQMRVFSDNADPKLPGPAQLASNISSTFAGALTLLDNTGSEVLFGTPQFIPAGNGLIFLRPWYVQPAGTVKIPALRCITVLANNAYVNRGLLEDALRTSFRGRRWFPNIDIGSLTGSNDCTRGVGRSKQQPNYTSTVLSESLGVPSTASPSTTIPPAATPSTACSRGRHVEDRSADRALNGDPTTAINKLKQANTSLAPIGDRNDDTHRHYNGASDGFDHATGQYGCGRAVVDHHYNHPDVVRCGLRPQVDDRVSHFCRCRAVVGCLAAVGVTVAVAVLAVGTGADGRIGVHAGELAWLHDAGQLGDPQLDVEAGKVFGHAGLACLKVGRFR
jgi:hypothetical protein